MLRFILIVVVVGLAAAFVTKPSEGDIDRLVRERLAVEIESGAGIDPANNGGQLILSLCRANRNACVDILSQFVGVEYEDELLYARIRATLPGQSARTCIGAFTKVVCPGFLRE